MQLEIIVSIGIIAIGITYSKRKIFENLFDKNKYISNTNLLFKKTKECLLEKDVTKIGNKIFIYEISSLKKRGKLIKIIQINKLPLKIKRKQNIKYAVVPSKIEIQTDIKKRAK